MSDQPFETPSVRLSHAVLVTFQAPREDVDRIMNDVVTITPLPMGKYDSNAFETASGVERYRPREGAGAGAEDGVRKRPGVVEVSFEVPADRGLLDAVIEAIFRSHSYEEPVIRLQQILSGRSKGLDDRDNPNRWWNTTGDWMTRERPTGAAGSDGADG